MEPKPMGVRRRGGWKGSLSSSAAGERGAATRWGGSRLRLVRTVDGWKLAIGTEGLPVSVDRRGRYRVGLHRQHPYACSGAWAYLLRFLVQEALGRRLLSSEHAHHVDHDKAHNELANAEVLAAWYHGRLHGGGALLANRGPDGRFRELARPVGPFEVRRDGPILVSKDRFRP